MIRTILTLLAMTAALLLSGCGFKPVHATSAGQTSFNDIRLVVEEGDDEIDRQAGFQIRQRLRDRVGTSTQASYILTVRPSSTRIPLGLTGLDRASRFDSNLYAYWKLTEADKTEILASGTVNSATTFAADDDPYRLNATDNAARERVARDVADKLLVDLALYFADNSAP
ncbi:hypothetical protein ACFFUB_00760 [Algimonas porphyrae]|uniref:Twin-arginine translocation pathway signal protein n=1 Tax=Algimonas porphyrae TaxID=1128113 RepID=A0ABQ5V1K2_9PROT|nr:hypothetical protein [Algimonas porphyrae]GLQ20564.1 twin-arginine translocation pathway signal protein [Algimonas porphyrae]